MYILQMCTHTYTLKMLEGNAKERQYQANLITKALKSQKLCNILQ